MSGSAGVDAAASVAGGNSTARGSPLRWRPRLLAALALWVITGLFLMGAAASALGHETSYADWSAPARFALGFVATLLGPFLGGFVRDWQSCCAANSWGLFPYALGALASGVGMQWVPLAPTRAFGILRATAWGLGWFAWFAAGALSCGHALE